MRPVFVDSSFIIAFLSKNDAHHEKAVRLLAALQRPLLTTKWILVEVGGHFRTQPYRERYPVFVQYIESSEKWQVLSADDESFAAGLSLYGNRPDKGWSLVDCISITVMQRLDLTDALTGDHHFEQAGFHALLR